MREARSRDASLSGMIVREREPVNLESPFDQLDGFLTANDRFYVRSHFQAPRLCAESYQLKVEGAVRQEFAIGLAELRQMPAVTVTVTLECAGNGRIFLSPPVKGVQWQLGAVSTAAWTGVPLHALLERAGVLPHASEIVFEGADQGTPKGSPTPTEVICYARSIALEKAKDVLVAYEMNGEELPIDHGFPVRAVVPGHYGMASVKWLTGIRAVQEPFEGYWQTWDYAYWDEVDGNPVRRPLGEGALKSAIARPRAQEIVAGGTVYPVFGAAWCGELAVEQVEVSTDDGATWQTAKFLDPPRPFCWRRWEFAWQAPRETGIYILKSRARDSCGNLQPEEHDTHYGSYVIHHIVGIEVVVE